MMSVDERRSLVWANLTSGNIFHMHIIQHSQFARVENDKIVVCDTLCRMVIAALEHWKTQLYLYIYIYEEISKWAFL